MPNGFLTTENILDTDTQLLGYPEQVYYSGASGVNVDNTNLIISLTGEVGKTYTGVNPIVVNNEENLISANSAPIGVQEPLYFVQDDDEAVVIGLSGEYVTPSDIAGKLDTSSFESWQQGQYTNDLTAINEKINEVSSNIPSIEGLATEQLVEETSATIVSQIPSTAGLASETYVQEQTSAKASKSDLETVSGELVNLIPDVSNFYTKDETSGASQLAEAFANIPGGDEEVNALVHSNSATWNEVSTTVQSNSAQWAEGGSGDEEVNAYVYNNSASIDGTTSVVKSNSGTWSDITAYQSNSASYATIVNIGSNQYGQITGYNNSAIFATAAKQAQSDVFNRPITSTYYTTANANTLSSMLSAAIDYVSANAGGVGDEEVNQAVHTNSGTWNTVTDKLNTTAFSDVSSTFLTAVDLTPYATTAQLADKIDNSAVTFKSIPGLGNTVSGISGYKLYSYTAENSQWANAAERAYKDNNRNDITATYQTIAGMTAYQPTLTFGYDEQDRINSINSSALAGGGYVPEGVMVESAVEYNAVNEISGYNGSAIAQYGAEKQWLVHDDTLVHAANSAQYALGVAIDNVARLMGVDETLLWSGSIYTTAQSAGLSDSVFNYKSVKFYYTPYKEPQRRLPQIRETVFDNTKLTGSQPYLMHEMIYYMAGGSITGECFYSQISDNGSTLRLTNGIRTVNFNAATTGITAFSSCLSKIVGIGRKS